jgi:cytochrome c oxidase assembly factor CtaG
MRALVAVASAIVLVAAPALAHEGQRHGAALPWTFDPWIVAPLSISAALYAVGTGRLARRSGLRRRGLEHVCYVAGWLALAAALISPLHWLGEHLFTFHMIEHEIVMAVAAPLLILARPLGPLLWALPKATRRRLADLSQGHFWRTTWNRLTHPAGANILHGIAIWVWHLPALFDAAVENDVLHRLQHLSFFITALLFWWALLRRCNAGMAVGHLFVTMLHTSALGALMALAPRVLYAVQTQHALDWGLTPLEDQQLAGLIMWVPAGTIYAGAALVFAARWIRRSRRDWRTT